jgi:FkbM family methyltransferase
MSRSLFQKKNCLVLFVISFFLLDMLYWNLKFNETVNVKTTSNNYMETCLKDVLFNLPYNPQKDKYSVHHYTAQTGKWNENIRFHPLKINSQKCIIIDVGGNTIAEDTSTFLQSYPQCEYYVYEPIPSYFENLERVFHKYENVHIKGVGWGNKDEDISISSSSLKGQATFIMDTKGEKGNILLKIKTPASILDELTFSEIDLLHMNCEGCEWDALIFMGENDLFKKFKTIQYSAHNYGKVGIGVRSWELCKIKTYLNITHDMVEGVPFGWERWEKKYF